MSVGVASSRDQIVHEVREEDELLGWIAIDSTIAGRARGGFRLVHDLNVHELREAARAMTLKYGFLGLPQGGAKGGVLGDPEAAPAERRELLARFARAAAEILKAERYVPDSDMGTSGPEIDAMLRSVGVRVPPRDKRGRASGFYTAVTTATAARAALEGVGQSVAGAQVAIEGFGSVGSNLAKLLVRGGAKVVAVSTSRGAVHDARGLDVDLLATLASEHGSRFVEQVPGAERLEKEELFLVPVDLLAPCARYHGLSEPIARGVRARVVCGGANNPWSPEAGQVFRDRGILCVPDFVANCGGVLGGTMEYTALDPGLIQRTLEEGLEPWVSWFLREVEGRGVDATELAESLALARFERVRRSAENPSFTGRLFGLALQLYREGFLPSALVRLRAPRYFRALLADLPRA